jgi:hypothetical protein
MTSKQLTVMWLGIILITARLLTTGQWSAIWGIIGNSSGSSNSGITVTPGVNSQGAQIGSGGEIKTAPGVTPPYTGPQLYSAMNPATSPVMNGAMV